jgi:predicted O-methyltransferase YrrM
MSRWNSKPLREHFDDLMKRPERYVDAATAHLIVDTRDHLPLFRSVAHGNVVEIGTDVGHSTLAFLLGVQEKGGHVYSIDIRWECKKSHLGNPNWTFIHGDSLKQYHAIRAQLPLQYDVLYVDGDHTYEGAQNDIQSYGQFVRPGGYILVHDVLHPDYPGVQRAFREASGDKHVNTGSWGLGVIKIPSHH